MSDTVGAVSPSKRSEGAARVPAAALLTFARDAFMACGLPAEDAQAVARVMVEADLTGVDTHGIARLPQYVPWLQGGQINPRARVRVAEQGPAVAAVSRRPSPRYDSGILPIPQDAPCP